jgi:hypothetical protein
MLGLFLYLFLVLCHSSLTSTTNENETLRGKRFLQSNNDSSENHRFDHANEVPLQKTGSDLVLFIAITSGPHHSHLRHAIRNSWILPCRASAVCDYRFFIDADYQKNLAARPEYSALRGEDLAYGDIVFRKSCSLMKEHPIRINYGNSPVIHENLFFSYTRTNENGNKTEIKEDLPDYPLRRRYKIDWKVCFMRWIMEHYQKVSYYVFVEDDSFVCTENLIYQMTLLSNQSTRTSNGTTDNGKNTIIEEFRTGTMMYDGFDDSSTIMSAGVAKIFVDHYPSATFNCSKVFERVMKNPNDTSFLAQSAWMSWGNSWQSEFFLFHFFPHFSFSFVRSSFHFLVF